MALTFTTIQHAFRKSHGLSMNEYTLCDMIYHLSTKPSTSVPGWCYMTKASMGKELGVTKQAVLNMLDRLISGGFLIKNDETKFLQTTEKWQEVYDFNDGKESLPNNIYKDNNTNKGSGAALYESLIDQSFEVFSEAGLTGVFFEKMKKLHGISSMEVNNMHTAWQNKNQALGTEFKSKDHMKNSFNRFITESKKSGGRTIPQESVKIAKAGVMIG